MPEKRFPKADARLARELYVVLGRAGVEKLAELSAVELHQTVQLAASAYKEGVSVQVPE